MFDRPWRIVPALIVLGLLPAAIIEHSPARQVMSVAIAAKPVALGVQVAVRPFDLQAISASEFGDSDSTR